MKYQTIAGLVLLTPCLGAAQEAVTVMPTVVVRPDAEPPQRKTPASITEPGSGDEISGRELEHRSIDRVEDLQSRVPNLISRTGGTRSLNNVIGYRGMVNNAFYGDPAVGLYVDDVPYQTTLSFDPSFLEVSRVELFRGPQFTRYGRQGPAGLLSIHSKEPGERFSVRAQAGFASHDEQTYKLHLDGPLGQQFGFTLSGMYSRRDGYLYNDLKDVSPDYQDGWSGRASLFWKPTDRLLVKFIGTLQHFDDGVQRYTNLDDTPRTIEHDYVGKTKGRSDMQSLQVEYTGDDFILQSFTSRRNFRLDPATFDLDFSPVPFLPTAVYAKQLTYTQEFRLRAAKPDRWDWFLGAYAAHSELDVLVNDTVYIGDSTLTDKSLALFGDLTRKFDHGWEVTAGLRGEITEKEAVRALDYPDGSTTHEDLSHTVRNISPKVALTWRATQDLLFYGSSSISYRAGGYSLFNFAPAVLRAGTERTWANEIGAKAQLLDRKLEVSLAGFWNDIHNYQIERYVLGGFGIFTAEEATTRGVELEITARPLEGLELTAGLGWVDAQFDEYQSLETGEDLAGNTPPYVPNVTFNLAAQYKHTCGFFARVEWIVTGDTFFDETNMELGEQDAYGLFNARLGYEAEHWAVYVFGKNLTDTEYYSLKIPNLGAGIIGDPRSVGMMVSLNF